MKKYLIRLADGSMLTRKAIYLSNIYPKLDRYVKKLALQDATFDILTEQGELFRQIRYLSGVRILSKGGKRKGAGRKPIYAPRVKISQTILDNATQGAWQDTNKEF